MKRNIPKYEPGTRPNVRATRVVKPLRRIMASEQKVLKHKHGAKHDENLVKVYHKPAVLYKPAASETKPANSEPKPAEPKPQRVKAERKPVPKSTKAVQQPAKLEDKPSQADSKSSELGSKSAEAVKSVTQAKAPPMPSVEPQPDGHYELNPLMTRMLDHELQRIMIKVWQELPDAPPSEAEKLVADKFRNTTGDDLRNVLGLNVTKRLLNIHNTLFVKMTFSRKPEAGHLKQLLRSYNCVAIKRSAGRADFSSVAQMKSVADFDRICRERVVRCGSVRVHVTPCYDFRQCPEKLKTTYEITKKEINDDIPAEKAEADNKTTTVSEKEAAENSGKKITANKTPEKKKAETAPEEKTAPTPEKKAAAMPAKKVEEIPEKKTGQTADKTAVKTPEKKAAESEKKAAETVDKKAQEKKGSVTTPLEKKIEIPLSDTKPAGATLKKTEITQVDLLEKKTEVRSTENEPAKDDLSKRKTTEISSKNTENQTVKKNITGNSEVKNVKTLPNKTPVGSTNNASEEIRNVKVVSETPKTMKKNEINTVAISKANSDGTKPKVVAKPKQGSDINAKKGSNVSIPKSVNTKVKSANAAKKTVKTKVSPTKNKLKDMIVIDENTCDDEFDENDVLSDDDILALMSGAIVLDECSGSEDE